MERDWSLREEIYGALHRWPTIVIYVVVGCLIGWAVSYIWPANYRATTQVYVGINPYRAYSDTTFLALARPKYSNIDDYKNWQMSQLETVIFLDSFMGETLTLLRQQDPYWEDIEIDPLREMFDSNWRSAGKWSLLAEHKDSRRATQAVQSWSEITIQGVQNATLAARDAFMIDQELDTIATELVQAELRQEELTSANYALREWGESAEDHPPDQPLEQGERWHILSTVAGIADFTPGWMALLDAQPSPDAPPIEYTEWIDQITAYIKSELSSIQKRVPALREKHVTLGKQYAEAAGAGLGLAPSLVIEGLEYLPTKRLRPTSTLALIGGVVGLLVWVLSVLVKITKQTHEED